MTEWHYFTKGKQRRHKLLTDDVYLFYNLQSGWLGTNLKTRTIGNERWQTMATVHYVHVTLTIFFFSLSPKLTWNLLCLNSILSTLMNMQNLDTVGYIKNTTFYTKPNWQLLDDTYIYIFIYIYNIYIHVLYIYCICEITNVHNFLYYTLTTLCAW